MKQNKLDEILAIATEFDKINADCINKLHKICGEHTDDAIRYYFTQHEFCEDTYLDTKIDPLIKMRIAKVKVDRFLEKKKNKHIKLG